ncbi:MAG: hypothetical protein ACUVXB_06415 [Bryobacteraceae bacterium]
MRRHVALLFFLAQCVLPAQRWSGFAAGPFEVLSDAGERDARQRLAELEQFRFALEQLLGKENIHPVWPVRVLALRNVKDAPAGLGLAREAYVGAVPARGPLPAPFLRGVALLLIRAGPRGLPSALEEALAEVFSTMITDGARITLGTPPPAQLRTADWALMHMLVTTPGYYSGVRVLIRNLERGVEKEPAWRNAFGKTEAQLRPEAEAHLRAGRFETVSPHSRTLRPEKDFRPLKLAPGADRIALGDLTLAQADGRSGAAQQAYQAAVAAAPGAPEALEGLALLALREAETKEALSLLRQATEASSNSARAWYEYGRLEPDQDKAVTALERAAKLNPRWALPHYALAEREPDRARRAFLLGEAAKRDPRNVAYWRALAELQEAAGQFFEAAKTWAAAEQAAATPEEREKLRQLRLQAEVRRREQEAEAKRRAAREEAEELERLKQKAVAAIQAALDKAQRENPPMPSSGPVVPWWDGPQPDAKVSGLLVQVDCLGKLARLVIQIPEGNSVRLLVRDPNQIAVVGAGEKFFGCGPQKPARKIRVEYFAKPDVKLGTAGEVAVLEFP